MITDYINPNYPFDEEKIREQRLRAKFQPGDLVRNILSSKKDPVIAIVLGFDNLTVFNDLNFVMVTLLRTDGTIKEYDHAWWEKAR